VTRLKFGSLKWRDYLALAAIVMATFHCGGTKTRAATIISGSEWIDQNGTQVQGHGGSVIRVGRTFFWFGENKTNENSSNDYFQSVRCYSSPDLAHWTFVSDALIRQASGYVGPGRIVERPKVIYNRRTAQYVMYMHIDKPGYGTGKVGIAQSSSVSGPYTFLKSIKPLGLQSWDLNLFQDNDGTAYLLSHGGDDHLHIDRLSEDYLDVIHSVAALHPNYEAPAMFKLHGRYYLLGSELTGWNCNDNKFTTATNLAGPWSKWNLFAPAGSETYNSQTMQVLLISGTRGTTALYMGDRWNSSDLGASTYAWFPMQVNGPNLWLVGYASWDFSAATGIWKGIGPPPAAPRASRPNLAHNKSTSSDSEQPGNGASNANDGDVATRWCANDGNSGHWWKVDLGKLYDLAGTEAYWEMCGAYQYKIDVSTNNSVWTTVVDKTANSIAQGLMDDDFRASARYVRITVTGLPPGTWASAYEFEVFPAAIPLPCFNHLFGLRTETILFVPSTEEMEGPLREMVVQLSGFGKTTVPVNTFYHAA
jgi:hypothetical protein